MSGERLWQSSLLPRPMRSNLAPLELVAIPGSCWPDVLLARCAACSAAHLPPWLRIWSRRMPGRLCGRESFSLEPRLEAASLGRAQGWPSGPFLCLWSSSPFPPHPAPSDRLWSNCSCLGEQMAPAPESVGTRMSGSFSLGHRD